MNFLLSLGTAFLFYLAIPLGGAFWVRAQWRLFRRRILTCSLKREIHYGALRRSGEGHLGDYRFMGTLQAIQGEDTIWVTNGKVSLPVHLEKESIYTLPHFFSDPSSGNLSEEIPRPIKWKQVFALHEGTRIFVCGGLWREGGQLLFRNSPSQKLVILIYDGSEGSILTRCLWGGRQKNEYINDLSPWSIFLGALLLLLEAYVFYRQPLNHFAGRVTVLLGVAPLAVFLPPGVALFQVYRKLWRRGRIYRTERDLVRLPLRFWPKAQSLGECKNILLPQGGSYGFHRYRTGKEAMERNPRNNLLKLLTLGRKDRTDGECLAFGPLDEEGRGEFTAGSDALTGVTLLPGDPYALSALSALRARRMELLSCAAFGLGFGINLILLFLLLNTLLP